MDNQLIFTPSEFVDVFNQSIEYAYPRAVLQGEISNFKVSKNRWVYFDIKDETATVKCFGTVYVLPGPLEDGMLVQIVCTPRLHPQFNFSLQIQTVVPKGEGAIAKASELLFKKLEMEGLFATERKRLLPFAPERIALITSSESAAYADFIKVSGTRWPAMSIDVYGTLVQGIDAPDQIVKAIESANSSSELYDAIVLVRGGGSAEDLAAFNDERIVRALAASRAPTLVAIGHEIDESLAELVADCRASTPSYAAELLTPEIGEEMTKLASNRRQLHTYISAHTGMLRQTLISINQQVIHNVYRVLDKEWSWLGLCRSQIDLLDPRTVLNRGYAMIYSDNKVISSVHDFIAGQDVNIHMKDGEARAKIL